MALLFSTAPSVPDSDELYVYTDSYFADWVIGDSAPLFLLCTCSGLSAQDIIHYSIDTL